LNVFDRVTKKCSDTNFHENPFCGRQVVPYGQTNGRTNGSKDSRYTEKWRDRWTDWATVIHQEANSRFCKFL